jgi:hypothetical protein
MTDLIRIFLLDARQRQLRESLCGMNLDLGVTLSAAMLINGISRRAKKKNLVIVLGFYV